MEKSNKKSDFSGELRQKAEKFLKKQTLKLDSHLSEVDTLKLIHELEVHQIELEMQNEALIQTKAYAADLERQKYVELYDFVPSGFFTLNHEGNIIGLNLYGSQMLGKERLHLRNSMFGFFVSDDSRTIFNHFLWKIFESRTSQTCEVTLSSNGALPIFVNLNGIITGNGEQCLVTAVDITVSKQSVETIKLREKQRLAILQTAIDGFWVLDLQGALLEVNEAYCRMSGYNEKELLSMRIHELEAAEATSDIAAHIQKIVNLGEDRFETKQRRKDGSIFDVEISVHYQPAEGGRFVAFLHDITQRKLAEENLHQREELYISLFQGNHSVMLLIDADTGDIKDANPAASQYYGWTHSEMCSKNISDINTFSKNEVMSEMLKAQEVKRNHFFNKHQLANGQVRDVEIYSGPIKSRDSTLLYSIVYDITDRKLTEEALVESERFLRDSQALAHIGSYKADLIARTWKGTSEIDTILGIDETYPHTIEDLTGLIHPDSRKELFGNQIQYEVKKNGFDHEFKIIRLNDGKERWVHGLGELEFDHQKKPIRIIGTLRDITRRKHTEEALNRLNEELEDRVRERTAELLNVKVEVEELERNRFSRELHDGLGPLLSAVKLYFQWLSETDDVAKIRIITEKGNNYIEKAIQTTREVALGLSSVILNNMGYTDTLLNYVQSINDTQKLIINFKYNSKDRFNNLLETNLYRITIELINNTVKYAKATYVNIAFNYHKSKNRITFSYLDNGIGFDLDNTLKTSKGLGLMNIQQRIKIIGGTFKIETSCGNGMKVFIELPVR